MCFELEFNTKPRHKAKNSDTVIYAVVTGYLTVLVLHL